MKYYLSILFLLLFYSCNSLSRHEATIISKHNYLKDFPTYSVDSLVNVVIEIPAGCNQKWETNKETGYLEWEKINQDSLRMIDYLPYPANYGFVPQTLSDKQDGGDNDPLDVFVFGSRIERGKVVQTRIIGVIEMLDNGEHDDKLIAIPSSTHWKNIKSLSELEKDYPGVLDILTTWLSNYKGRNKIKVTSVKDEQHARKILKSNFTEKQL